MADRAVFYTYNGRDCSVTYRVVNGEKLTPIRFASLMMGIWYLSTATANKFAGMLAGLYPEAGKVKSLFGYQIASMYDFFMVFVVMSELLL